MQNDSSNKLHEPDLTGRKIGDFTIINRLGRGGMADVYLAEQKSLRRKIALKILHQSLASDPSYVKRFKNEAQAAAALTHPNIVQIFEVGTLENFHYISQEYVEGQNLKQYLNRYKSVTTFMAVTTLRQVAAALHKAKQQGVIHRDIKPENIMITPDGEVKVADFGLARIKRADENQELTQIGMTMGTPLYMSPEQAEGAEVDHRSDIYSLGVTAYNMLAGRPPFEKETAIATAIAHKTETPLSLLILRQDIPPELDAIVTKMMAKSPEDRFQECGGIIADLLTISLDASQEKWSDAFKSLSPSEANAVYSSHLEATQELDRVIHGTDRRNRQIVFSGIIAVLTILLFFVGGQIAALYPPPSILDSNLLDDEKLIPKLENVDQQYVYAEQTSDSEYEKKIAAFRAVQNYFPPDPPQANAKLSKGHWAEFYIGMLHYNEKAFVEAEESFRLLSELKSDEFPTFYFHGQAGLVLLDYAQNRIAEVIGRRADIMTHIDIFPSDLREKLVSIYTDIDEEKTGSSGHENQSDPNQGDENKSIPSKDDISFRRMFLRSGAGEWIQAMRRESAC